MERVNNIRENKTLMWNSTLYFLLSNQE